MPLVKHGMLPASPAVIEKSCNTFIHQGMNYKLHCPASCHKCPTNRAPDTITLSGRHIWDHSSYVWDHEPALRGQSSLWRGWWSSQLEIPARIRLALWWEWWCLQLKPDPPKDWQRKAPVKTKHINIKSKFLSVSPVKTRLSSVSLLNLTFHL